MSSKNIKKKLSAVKRVRRFRDVKQTNHFHDDWERLDASGKHDMNAVKEAMSILAFNDGSMPPEWKDHQLTGNLKDYRECHVKGDLLLVYNVHEGSKTDLLTFSRICTHSELFG